MSGQQLKIREIQNRVTGIPLAAPAGQSFLIRISQHLSDPVFLTEVQAFDLHGRGGPGRAGRCDEGVPPSPLFGLQEEAYGQLGVIPAICLYHENQKLNLPAVRRMLRRANKL